MKQPPVGDDPPVAHLMNLFSGTLLTYVGVTRGGLAVARGFEYLTRRAG